MEISRIYFTIYLLFSFSVRISPAMMLKTSFGEVGKSHVCNETTKEAIKTMQNSVKKSYEVDVVFVFDRSESVKDLFDMSKELLRTILNRYYLVHPDFARVSIVTFAHTAQTIVDASHDNVDSCVQEEMLNRVQRIALRQEERESAISKGLDAGARLLRNSNRNASKILWLFSDGMEKTTSGHDINYISAGELKEEGVEIFVVGQRSPGKGWMELTDELHLKQLTSSPGHYSCVFQWEEIFQQVPAISPDPQELGNRVYSSVNVEESSEEVSEEVEGEGGDGGVYPERIEGRTCVCPLKHQGCFCNALTRTLTCTCTPEYYLVNSNCVACPAGTSKPKPGPAPCQSVPIDKEDTIVVFGARVTIKLFSAILAGCIGLLLLVVVLAVTVCCIKRRRQRKQQNREYVNTAGLAASPKKKRRPPPPPPAAPPPPCFDPPDYEDAIYGDVDLNNPALYKGESLEQDMPGWPQYMIDGIQKHFTSGMSITTLDHERWAKTPGFNLSQEEIKNIAKTLNKVHDESNRKNSGYVNMEILVQGKKYTLLDNNGILLNAVGPVKGRSQNVLWATISEDTVIVAKAPADKDKGQCKSEVKRVLQHLKAHN